MSHGSCINLKNLPLKSEKWFCGACQEGIKDEKILKNTEIKIISSLLLSDKKKEQDSFLELLQMKNFLTESSDSVKQVERVLVRISSLKCIFCNYSGGQMFNSKEGKYKGWMHYSCSYWLRLHDNTLNKNKSSIKTGFCEVCGKKGFFRATCFSKNCTKEIHPECARLAQFEMVLPNEIFVDVNHHILFCHEHSKSVMQRRIENNTCFLSKREQKISNDINKEFPVIKNNCSTINSFINKKKPSLAIYLEKTNKNEDGDTNYKLVKICHNIS